MIKSKNPVYWLLKIKNPTHQIDENLGLNPGWVFWFSSLEMPHSFICIYERLLLPVLTKSILMTQAERGGTNCAKCTHHVSAHGT